MDMSFQSGMLLFLKREELSFRFIIHESYIAE